VSPSRVARPRAARAARRRTSRAPEAPAGDTIVALATAAGASAVGVVRLSGPRAVAIGDTIVRGRAHLEEQPSHTQRHVAIVDPKSGERLDDALCSVMRAPRSYTGEDVVELSCHGSPALLRAVIERLCAQGARLAAPGEFTRRAFINGRLDLAQAEAVALLISARTERAVVLAARGVAGELGRGLRGLRERLLDLVAGLEVALDFPEDGVGIEPTAAAATVQRLIAEVVALRERARRGRIVHDGVTIALVGAPNAGKSSLFNALVGRERAIVSPMAGTTRDVIEATIDLAGVPLRLLDTAGIGAPRDAVEAEGIRRSRAAIEESDLLLVVVDGSRPLSRAVLEEAAPRPRILVRAKSDLPTDASAALIEDAVDVSAVSGAGLDLLAERICLAVMTRSDADGEVIASLRQMEALDALQRALIAAAGALAEAPIEVALVDFREALVHASALLGLDVGDAVLDRIFANFCLGK
jgi:tRNA modification GTPase